MKTCTECRQEKAFSDFHKKKSYYHSQCKVCRNSKNRVWYDVSDYKRIRTPVPKEKSPNSLAVNRKTYRLLRKKRVKEATPDWAYKNHRVEFENLVWLREDLRTITGEDYHIDHIIPLAGKDVCGLNVPWNLQILPADLNLKKSNKW